MGVNFNDFVGAVEFGGGGVHYRLLINMMVVHLGGSHLMQRVLLFDGEFFQ